MSHSRCKRLGGLWYPRHSCYFLHCGCFWLERSRTNSTSSHSVIGVAAVVDCVLHTFPAVLCALKDARCSKKHFLFLTFKGHFKVKVKVNEVAHSSQLVKGYLVLNFGWYIFCCNEDLLLMSTDPRF